MKRLSFISAQKHHLLRELQFEVRTANSHSIFCTICQLKYSASFHKLPHTDHKESLRVLTSIFMTISRENLKVNQSKPSIINCIKAIVPPFSPLPIGAKISFIWAYPSRYWGPKLSTQLSKLLSLDKYETKRNFGRKNFIQ